MGITNESHLEADSLRGAKRPEVKSKLKEYGKQAYRPLLDVVFKYQDEFTPYLRALEKGLESGANSLSQDGGHAAETYVAGFFREASAGVKLACEKLEAKDIDALNRLISEQAEKRPSAMFAASYVAGLLFGRLSKHFLPERKNTINNEPASLDEVIH